MAVGRSVREGGALKIANFEKVRFFKIANFEKVRSFWRHLAAQCDNVRMSFRLI